MGQACGRWRDDLGAYILGALDGEERAAMRGHLVDCAACRADYEYLLPVRGWLVSSSKHLATCMVCRADYQELLQLGPLTTGPQARDLDDG
jgi:anti-sigma factor RsiW